MALSQNLHLRQSQSLVMTQQLQQSIKLLQLSSLELQEFVETELEKNPLLTREEGAKEAAREEEGAEDTANSIGENNYESDSADIIAQDSSAGSEMLDSNYSAAEKDNAVAGDGYYETGSPTVGSHDKTGGVSSSSRLFASDEYSLENMLSSTVTLREHLLQQLHCDVTNPAQRLIGSQLIDLVDEAGYLREDTSHLVELLGAEAADIEATIQNLQRFDPPGVFARDLKECLALQLIDNNHYDPAMQRMVQYLDLIAQGELTKLRELCEVDEEDLLDMMAEIRSLNPKPASDFTVEPAHAVVPDVIVRRKKDNGWLVELNHETLPKVLLDQTYHSELNDQLRNKEEKKFVSEQLANANWLVKALDQRAQTILKVSTEIIKQQEKFFLHGIRFLKPLTLKDVATEVDLHESTVSRVTTNKFMHTPRGTYELKYFFTSSVGSSKGAEDVSSKTVMHYIKELVDGEPHDAILSDDMLVKLLKPKGVDIARRTVTKYREAMHIPSSVVRRRQKKKV